MISKQLLLGLCFPQLNDWKDYYVTSSNKDVIEWLQHFLSIDIKILWIFGPPKSGKSYLGKLWQESMNALSFESRNLNIEELEKLTINYKYFIIDEAKIIQNNEEWFFHFFDHIIRNNAETKKILIFSRGDILSLNLKIKDLESRLKTAMEIAIQNPDDELIKKLIQKSLFEYGIRCTDNEMKIIVSNIERTYQGIADFTHSLHLAKTSSSGSVINAVRKILIR